jgi:hypothetical protein
VGKFKGQIFMGSGDRSMTQAGELMFLLMDTIKLVSDHQQQGLQGHSVDEEEYEEEEYQIKRNARQIYLALTGEKVPKKGD